MIIKKTPKRTIKLLATLATSTLLVACSYDEKATSNYDDPNVQNEIVEVVNANEPAAKEEYATEINNVLYYDPNYMNQNYDSNIVEGTYVTFSLNNFLKEEKFNEIDGVKMYELLSPINHENLLVNVTQIEFAKELSSIYTSDIIKASEGHTYIYLHVTGKNIANSAQTVDIHTFGPELKFYDENGEYLGKDVTKLNADSIRNNYLKLHGLTVESIPVEREEEFGYILAFKVEDEVLKAGTKIVLTQSDMPMSSVEEYEAPVHILDADFTLPTEK